LIEIRLLGQFDLRLDGKLVEIPSRPAQSLLAYLALTVGVAHRRERLAGLIWPDIPEVDARRNLRRALWYVRKTFQGQAPLRADDITVAFDPSPAVWVDALALARKVGPEQTVDELVRVVSAYGGELLPGFYDEWIIVEREQLQALFEGRIKLLLDRLVGARRWDEVLEWGERWIALAVAPEPAYRALMVAYSEQGDVSGVGHTYQRCVEALSRDLGVEPSEETIKLFKRLSHPGQAPAPESRIVEGRGTAKQPPTRSEPGSPAVGYSEAANSLEPEGSPAEPPFKGLQFFDEADADLFFGREELTARLLKRLGISQGGISEGENLLVIVGASGSGKSSLARAGLAPAIRHSVSSSGQPGSDREGVWGITIITPSAHPLEALAASLTRQVESVTAAATLIDDMLGERRSLRLYLRKLPAPLFLIVDQMEELFTLCRDERERRAFIDNLLAAVEGGRCKVVLTLRADFYTHCAQFENLRAALASSQEYIGPMSAGELRRAIEGPGRQAVTSRRA
jgi:DNA-binding SARP family transcriptional activator